MHFIVTLDYQDYFSTSKYMSYLKGGVTSVVVALKVKGGKIVTRA